jgi:hypothetical protein
MTKEFEMPVYGIMGNHDHENMIAENFEKPYGDKMLNYTAE